MNNYEIKKNYIINQVNQFKHMREEGNYRSSEYVTGYLYGKLDAFIPQNTKDYEELANLIDTTFDEKEMKGKEENMEVSEDMGIEER